MNLKVSPEGEGFRPIVETIKVQVVLGQFTTMFGAGTTFRGGLIGRDETVAVILGIDEPGGNLGDHHTSILFDTNHWADGDAVAAVADELSDLDFTTVADRFTNGSDEQKNGIEPPCRLGRLFYQ